ncbi:MAG: V-type ATP synthase subunit I [Candidatus Thermoplasmatota archaeon]|nr:V-type ATP synthase subunit I [Candidatus Thermoplasmatota archaeon]
MSKVSIIIHESYVEEVIKRLHELGTMEIVDISKHEPEFLGDIEGAEMHPEASTCATYELRLSRLISILQKVKVKPKGVEAFLHPELPEIKPIEDSSLEELYSYTEGILGEIEQHILSKEKQLHALKEDETQLDTQIEQISRLSDFTFDLSDIGESTYVLVKTGMTNDLKALQEQLQALGETELHSKQFGTDKKVEWAVVAAAHISHKDALERIWRTYVNGFDIERHYQGPAQEVVASLHQEKKTIADKRKESVLALQSFAKDQLDELLALREQLHLERVRKELPKNFAKTTTTYIVQGWALRADEKKLQTAITEASKEYALVEFAKPSLNPDNPPTHLKTPKWAESFRTFLELFSTPKYNELDPTLFLGIFFVLFFGLMLGDAGYGVVILSLSLFGYFKMGKVSAMIKSWAFLGIWLGLTTTLIGFLMNSFFGNLLPAFFGVQLPHIIDPLEDPLMILAIALICGLIQLNLGIILGIIQAAHRREIKRLFTHHFSWIPVQIGGGLLVGSFIMGWTVEGVLFYVAVALTLLGVILILIGEGPIGFFGITGYVGDWLSYARLLALGLATTGMALAFNVVSKLIGEMIPIIGIVITIVLLTLSHTVNLALQALGAGVHSLRLQYVEFFNRFYEGGGTNFSPFAIKRKYTKIEENVD